MLPRPRRGEPHRARGRTASPVSASLSLASRSVSFRRLPVVQARSSTTGSCLPALRRVWPLPAARNGPGKRQLVRQPIADRRGSSASAQPEPCCPREPDRPSRPGVLAPPGTARRPPISKSANAPLPFGLLLDEGCERPERPGGRGPLLDDGRKSSHRPGGHRGELREGQTVTATLAWGCRFEPTFCRAAGSILFCPWPNPERRFVTKSPISALNRLGPNLNNY